MMKTLTMMQKLTLSKKLAFRMKTVMVLAVLLFLTGCTSQPADSQSMGSQGSELQDAHSIFVATTGDDDNPGTIDAPFATIQAALDVATAGTAIYVREGTYYGTYYFTNSGNEEDGAITIQCYEEESVLLTNEPGEDGAVFTIEGQSNLVISGFQIGELTGENVFGILLYAGSSDITIENCEFYEIKTTKPDGEGEANAILMLGEGESDADAISNVTVQNCLVHDNVNGWSENISVAGNCTNISILSNTVYDCTNIGIDFYGNAGYCSNPLYDQPRFCEARGNVVSNCVSTYAENAGIYVDGAHDIIISENTVFDNPYGIEIGSEEWRDTFDENQQVRNVTVSNNDIHDNRICGIRIGGYTADDTTGVVRDCEIFENTLTKNGVEIWFAKCEAILLHDNVLSHAAEETPCFYYDEAYLLDTFFDGTY